MVRIGINKEPKFQLVKVKKKKKENEPKHDKHSKAVKVSAGWTVYDPTEGFILKPKCEGVMRDWIDRHGKFNYWLCVCVTNDGDKALEWLKLEFTTSAILEVSEAYIDGYEHPINVSREIEKDRCRYAIVIPLELPIYVPKGGSLRLFMKMHSSICNQRYVIEGGVLKTESNVISLPDLIFRYSCDVRNIKEEPDLIMEELGRRIVSKIIGEKAVSYYYAMIALADAGEKRVVRYVNLLEKLKECSNKHFYEKIERCLKYAITISSPLTFKGLKDVPNYDVELSDLENLKRCLIDALLHLEIFSP